MKTIRLKIKYQRSNKIKRNLRNQINFIPPSFKLFLNRSPSVQVKVATHKPFQTTNSLSATCFEKSMGLLNSGNGIIKFPNTAQLLPSKVLT